MAPHKKRVDRGNRTQSAHHTHVGLPSPLGEGPTTMPRLSCPVDLAQYSSLLGFSPDMVHCSADTGHNLLQMPSWPNRLP